MSSSHVQFYIRKQVLQTPMIGIGLKSLTVQVVMSYLKEKDYGGKLKIVSGVVLFMRL